MRRSRTSAVTGAFCSGMARRLDPKGLRPSLSAKLPGSAPPPVLRPGSSSVGRRTSGQRAAAVPRRASVRRWRLTEGVARAACVALTGALVACGASPSSPAAAPPSSPAASGCPADRALVLSSQAALSRLASCTQARGLTIRSGARLDTSVLRALETISGDLVIGPTIAVEEISLPALRTLDGALRIRDNALAQGVFLPRLERAGQVEVENNAALTTVSLPRLTRIAGGLSITDDASLELIDLSRLEVIDGPLVVANQPSLTLFESEALRRAASVRLDRVPKLPDDVAARLRETPGPGGQARPGR
jgi:hypothetical protein